MNKGYNSGRYVGEMQNDMRHGRGVFYYRHGACYCGEWQNDKRSGTGCERNTAYCYVGHYANGVPSGRGTRFNEDGTRFVGIWNGVDAVGVMYYPDGSSMEGKYDLGVFKQTATRKKPAGAEKKTFLEQDGKRCKYTGALQNGQRHGYGVAEWEDGCKYSGEWQNDKRNGYGVCVYKDGDVYSGEWKDDQWTGFGDWNIPNGNRYTGQWKDGKGDGYMRCLRQGMPNYEGEMANDDYNGFGTIYSDETEFSYEGHLKDGCSDGFGTKYLGNYLRYDGYFQRGMMHGEGRLTCTDTSPFHSNLKEGDYFCGNWWENDAIGTLYHADGTKERGVMRRLLFSRT